jgi:hypothetical protein
VPNCSHLRLWNENEWSCKKWIQILIFFNLKIFKNQNKYFTDALRSAMRIEHGVRVRGRVRSLSRYVFRAQNRLAIHVGHECVACVPLGAIRILYGLQIYANLWKFFFADYQFDIDVCIVFVEDETITAEHVRRWRHREWGDLFINLMKQQYIFLYFSNTKTQDNLNQCMRACRDNGGQTPGANVEQIISAAVNSTVDDLIAMLWFVMIYFMWFLGILKSCYKFLLTSENEFMENIL